ncbi:MAG: FAD-binding oxidoreductase [Spirochaetales bacterium]|nr:FAD-binding oxidoreductase [Spirochaetales bacterium]
MEENEKPQLSIRSMDAEFQEFLRDESRMSGSAETISFPASQQQLQETLAGMYERGIAVTIQGARTGITGGAVPQGGHVLNFSRLNRILGMSFDGETGRFLLKVQPGLLLAELNEALRTAQIDSEGWTRESKDALRSFSQGGAFFFPPDPTETGASIGGMASTNASGACSFLYGPTRRYIRALRLFLADGTGLSLRRNTVAADGRKFRMVCDSGRVLEGELPGYRLPRVKNAAGYYVEDGMDLLDLFIGSEGTLGVLAELELEILPRAPHTWGLMVFLSGEEAAVAFVDSLRQAQGAAAGGGKSLPSGAGGDSATGADAALAAIEYFDGPGLRLLEKQRRENPAFAGLPEIPPEYEAAVYLEYNGLEEEAVENRVMEMAEHLGESGGSEDATWMATTSQELARLKEFRHALPEAVNLLIDERRRTYPQLTKLGTDMAVPNAELASMIRRYRTDLGEAGLEAVKFGHIGDNHVHVNILPRNPEDYERGKELYAAWAEHVVAKGGTVSAEHGIGKLKRSFLVTMYGEKGVGEMRRLRRIFDPKGLLNPGNLTS